MFLPVTSRRNPQLIEAAFALHGADIALYSATKFLGGHGDVIAGVVCCDETHAGPLRTVRAATGGLLHPLAAYLLRLPLPLLSIFVK